MLEFFVLAKKTVTDINGAKWVYRNTELCVKQKMNFIPQCHNSEIQTMNPVTALVTTTHACDILLW